MKTKEKKNEKATAEKKKNLQRHTVSPSFTLNKNFRRFSQRNTIFGRTLWDKTLSFFGQSMYDNVPSIIEENRVGYTRLEHAWAIASWTVHDYFRGAFSWEKLGDPNNIMTKEPLKKYEVTAANKEDVTKFVKYVAKSFGASLVGIAPYDERWIYTHSRHDEPIKIPSWVTHVIAIAIEMKPYELGASPTAIHGYANALGYSQMAFTVSSLAEFIRELGYNAISSGNDTGLSIPMAISAGLGQLGRNGLLVTKEFGPRVRLCKILTDMPLAFDEPIDFGLTSYCTKCRKCAEACEVEAISFAPEPSFETTCLSNNKGIYRWAVNVEKCYQFWIENGLECSTCITACPFNLKTGGYKEVEPIAYWKDLQLTVDK